MFYLDINSLSPYIRVAMYSTLSSPFQLKERIIYDYELIFVKSGKCRIRINKKDYIAEKNNVVLLRPGIPHSFHSFEGIDFEQPHIHFDLIYNKNSTRTPVSFKKASQMSDYEKSLIQDDILKDMKIPFIFTPENPLEFQNSLFKIIDIFNEKKTGYQLLYKSALLKLLHNILIRFEHSAKETVMGDNIELIKDYIDSNYPQNITLDSLANQFYINKFTMIRRFKEKYGINIIKYCNKKRLEKAENMLETTGLTIKEIGTYLGFTDAYSFSRFFKNETGVSPAGYRQKNLQIFSKNT